MKLASVPVNQMMKTCGVKNNTQIYQWMKWYQYLERKRFTLV